MYRMGDIKSPFLLDITMGLFSKKKKTYVNTSITRMVEDKDIPDLGKTAAMEYVLSNQEISVRTERMSISEIYNKEVNNSLSIKMRSARNYAKNKYAYGLPKADLLIKEGVDIKQALTDYISSVSNATIKMQYAIFGPVNNYHFLREILASTYGYDIKTNELTVLTQQKGFKCYLQDAQIVYCSNTIKEVIDPDSLVQYGYAATSGYTDFRKEDRKRKHTEWSEDVSADHDYAVVYVSYKDAAGKEQVFTFTENFLDYEYSGKTPTDGLDESNTGDLDPNRVSNPVKDIFESKDYYQACYEYEFPNGTKGITNFTYEYGSGYIPTLDRLFNADQKIGEYLPNIYARLDGRKLNDDDLKDTDRFKTSKQIARRLELNYDNWVTELHKQIGSLEYVRQILMTTAIKVNDDNDSLTREYLYEYFMAMYSHMPDTFAGSDYNSLQKDYYAGAAKVGQTILVKDEVYQQSLTFNAIGYEDILGSIGTVGTTKHDRGTMVVKNNRGFFLGVSTVDIHYFRKQLTPNVYREIRVYGLSTTQYVEGGYTTVSAGGDDNLIVPFDISVLDTFNSREKNDLYCKSLIIMLHTVQVVKQKWYQTGIFKVIMFIVAVVVSLFTGGQGMTLYAILYAVAQAVVISVAVTLVAKFLVNVLHIDVGIVFAVIAVVAIIYGGYIALSDTVGVAGITAQQLLTVANTSFQISSEGMKLQALNVIKAINDSADAFKTKMQELKDRIKDLGITDIKSDYFLMANVPSSMDIRMGEFPADYIDRTKAGVDMSMMVQSLPGNYVDMAINIPTFQDFMRESTKEE